jgi:hypothetical protein
MQQKSGDHWRPLGFFSRESCLTTESHYSTFDQELLAAYVSICHFHNFYEGYLFQLWTDNKPLTTALSCSRAPFFLQRQQRNLAFISEFNVQML